MRSNLCLLAIFIILCSCSGNRSGQKLVESSEPVWMKYNTIIGEWGQDPDDDLLMAKYAIYVTKNYVEMANESGRNIDMSTIWRINNGEAKLNDNTIEYVGIRKGGGMFSKETPAKVLIEIIDPNTIKVTSDGSTREFKRKSE